MSTGGAGPRTPAQHQGTAYRASTYPPVGNPTSRPARRSVVVYGLFGTLFFLCAVVLAFFLGADLGVRTALLAAVFAALPLFVVVPTFLWLDRLEAEPRRYLVFAFLWGSLCAPVGALLLNTGVHLFFAAAGADDPSTLSALLSAPPVEEALKGLGILVILLVRRREFDGVLDGVVYAGLVGAGFAFSENILYLGRAYTEYGLAGLNAVFVLRCIMAPFAHPLFTACTGIGLGLAVSVARTVPARIGFGLGGFACAVLLHAIWNLSAAMGEYETMYFFFQVPVFLGFVALVVIMRIREATLIRRYLSQYADAGWLTHYEVAMLASVSGRRSARAWARANGGPPAVASMRAFQDAGSDLALLRSRMVRRSAEAQAADHERQLLIALTAHRAGFVGSPVV
jgi:RsiW-degrading membrane proteinase PrsW (M82 family)